ncbi:uncharacterized protein [Diabrotica undecimpunctata]|uniref:uncharacterized protein isoform X7 n=1 Tax=Diabrotica undecimpunctata TaxID=50387 RepID=UPI003B636DC2
MTNNWSNETIIDFINEIHLRPELWNVEFAIYKDRNAKKDAWALVAEKFHISSDEAYKKFKSLRTYAKNEEKKKIKSGSAGGKPVKWFAFDAISFILSQDTQNKEVGSENKKTNVTETQDSNISSDQEEVVDSETIDPLRSSVPSPKPRTSKRSYTTDPILEKAQNLLSNFGKEMKNEYASFGEHIANKLRKYDDYIRSEAEMKIMQILYECDMQMYKKRRLCTCTLLESPDTNS